MDAMRDAQLPVTVAEFSGTFSPTTILAVLERLVQQGRVRRLDGYNPPRYKLLEVLGE